MANEKPNLSFWQIWNMCFGFLGIQFGFALQNANVSRIFQTLGADMETIPLLWIAGPVTGLLVQPIVGYFSDRTWTRMGRRRPYFLWGAVFTSASLVLMPNSSVLWMAAGMLWIMDAAINVSMQPFRAFVGDNLPKKQQPKGFAMQSFFIGVGSVVASMLPWILAHFGVSNEAGPGEIPDTVRYAFYIGAVVLFVAVGWTVVSSKEYTPEQLEAFDEQDAQERPPVVQRTAEAYNKGAWLWLLPGLIGAIGVYLFDLDKQLYILTITLAIFGVIQLVVGKRRAAAKPSNGFDTVMDDLFNMPQIMKQLAWVQFFSWFALFAMWIYTTAAVTEVHYGSTDTSSEAYNQGANWVGVLFAAYNGFAAAAAVVIPALVRQFGLRKAHLINLLLGAAGFMSFLVIDDPRYLLISMVGVGFAWASILSLPYAMLAGCLPANKMGVYMGIFNFFISIPQLLAATILGLIVKFAFDNQPIYALVVGAVSLVLAGICSLLVSTDSEEHA
ncbi:MFS transporter [Paraferrimonas sedimenticola]|uniref:MFS transporter n=1 Tax=Paraferrimonas sedimenticola TaxID=375674 RepID=A0AA37RVV6_9GAMM|nr:MFS transporter [Paraferrimonas sedimenticola]GLP95849.1 MFS transporter [Paraferrimonas sedimenticola]